MEAGRPMHDLFDPNKKIFQMDTKLKMKSFFLIRLKLIEMLIDLSVQLRSIPSKYIILFDSYSMRHTV